jgi:hypothetical protein
VAASHQEIEIPLASAQVIQHDRHAVACGCGRVHQAAAPAGAGAPGTVTYGLNLQAWCVFLIAAHAIPVHRCAELIESLTGARPSPGFVHAMIARTAAAVAQANKAIRALIILAPGSMICRVAARSSAHDQPERLLRPGCHAHASRSPIASR